VGAHVYKENIPLSDTFSNLLETKDQYSKLSWCGGDDYELLFTVAPSNERNILDMLKCHNHSITRIGEITEAQEITLSDEHGNNIDLSKLGYRHFED
ncbi:MAG: hypothetical protein P8H03_02675, partial [Emcibacteraceae bacterium]|nr:hypothetical protein [Emcibacteraceae bacterium]